MNGIYDEFGGSLTADVLNFNPDAIPEPDTLHIRMTRGERRIADELEAAKGWRDGDGEYGTGVSSVEESTLQEWADRIRKMAEKEDENGN